MAANTNLALIQINCGLSNSLPNTCRNQESW